MSLIDTSKLDVTFDGITTAVDIAISHQIGMPLPLSSKLFASAFYSEKKESHSVIHLLVQDWGIGNELYQELMEYLVYQDEKFYAYAELDRETTKLTKLGNVEAYPLPIIEMVA
jgi:hypothetical protein